MMERGAMMGVSVSALAPVAESLVARGDLAHLALFLWAGGASALLALTLRELAGANRRFDAFVRELARFNRRHDGENA